MCGLSALFSPRAAELATPIGAMTDIVRHRGPDDEGFVLFGEDHRPTVLGGPDTASSTWTNGAAYCPKQRLQPDGSRWHAALGHRRLSIVDLSPAGHQPMSSADGSLWIIYNGEIYNHIELRAELEREGFTFRTHCDTEVMLAAYRRWGMECLSRFNGMFAFVLIDSEREQIVAARDRFGVKPLYYWISPRAELAFASEIKQFSVLPGWRSALNGQRVYDFLNWGLFDHTAETLFKDVRQLRGGEYLVAPLARPTVFETRTWYTLANREVDAVEPARRYRELLEDSVRLRLRADVPVGSCLSGGLDSSSIVCVANARLRAAKAEAVQKTFSARSTDPALDEGRFIEAVVRRTGVENRQVQPSIDGLFETLPEMAWHQDEPFASTSIYAQWNVFRLARESGVTVMLDGQGADEQLAGYSSFFSARFARLARAGRLVRLLEEMRATRNRHGMRGAQVAGFLANAFLPEFLRQPLRRLAHRPGTGNEAWLDLERLGAHGEDPFLACGGKAVTVRDLSIAQLLYTSLPMLLHWEDRDSMAHSIEARVPFLDYRLVEFTLGLPEEQKLEGGITKRVLRDAMRGVLPEEVRTRTDKIGFATAEEQWLRTRPGSFRAALRDAVEASCGVLRPSALQLLEDIVRGQRPFSYLPWRMISFGAWMRRFGVALP